MLNLNTLKTEIFNEHNKIRKNPKSYIPILEKHLTYFKDDVMYKPNDPVGIMTQEGSKAFKECINFLKSCAPVKELQMNSSLSKSAQDHASDIGPKGLTDHIGSDGSEPGDRIERYLQWDVTIAENLDFGGKTGEEVIVSLIVDDGVKNRGHRSNVFKNDVKYIGIGLSQHKSDYEVCSVMAYVGNILDEKMKTFKEPSLDTIKVKMNSHSPKKGEGVPQKGGVNVKDEAKKVPSKIGKGGKKGPKKENFFGPKETYDFNDDEDKPKGAVDVKISTVTRKINGCVTKNITKTYKLKDGSTAVVEIEEVNM